MSLKMFCQQHCFANLLCSNYLRKESLTGNDDKIYKGSQNIKTPRL